MRLPPEYRCDVVVVLLEIGVGMNVIQSFKKFSFRHLLYTTVVLGTRDERSIRNITVLMHPTA